MNRLIVLTYFTVFIFFCNCQRWYLRPDKGLYGCYRIEKRPTKTEIQGNYYFIANINFPVFEMKKMILLETNTNTMHTNMNKNFCYLLVSLGSKYYCSSAHDDEYSYFLNPYRIKVVLTKINGISDTLKVMQHNTGQSVVNLRAPDFFTLNYNIYKKINYLIDQNVINGEEQEVCKVNVKNKNKTCKIDKENIQNIVLVNDFAQKDGELMELIENFISVKPKFIVLICGYDKTHLKINLPWNYEVIYSLNSVCSREIKEKNKNLIVVVTTLSQCKITHVTNVPVVYTKINRKDEECDKVTPNGIYPHVMKRNIVSTAIVHFLLEMGWQRVAIMSDDSFNSYLFQKDLIKEMDSHNMVYYESQAVINKEDILSTLKTLREKFARIIIVNVQEGKVSDLITAIKTFKMYSPEYIWIFTVQYRKMINLQTSYTDTFYVSYDNTDFNIGLQALNSFVLDPYNDDVTSYYRFITDYANNKYSNFKARILKLRDGQPNQTIVEMDIRKGKVMNVKRISSPYDDLPTDAPHCIISSYDFDKCQNDLLLLLVSVVSIFILFIAIIFLYFEELKTNNRYFTME